MRDLTLGEDVLSRDGELLGRVERIVVDAHAHRVTHLVLGGRVVPVGKLRDAGPDGLATTLDRDGFEHEEEFEASRFDPPGEHWQAPAGFRLQNFLAAAGALIGQGPYVPPTTVELAPLPRAHEVTEGSPVWSGDARLGEAARVLTDDREVLTGIVLRRDGIFGHEVVVPAARIVEIVGNNVHTDLVESELDELEPFREGE